MFYYKACQCAYTGDRYAGWQRQNNSIAIQNIIEESLLKLYGEEILIKGSGRTDSKVHGKNVIFNFKASKYYDNNTLTRGLNSILPQDIVIKDAIDVNESFHSGKPIISKSYEYRILNSPIRDPFQENRSLYIRREINIEKLEYVLSFFLGTHDFHSFCVKRTKKENTIRTINSIEVLKNDYTISIFINANGFLHNMVRIIIGTVLDILKNNKDPKIIEEIFLAKNRLKAGKTALAYGLYQENVFYNNENIPGLKGIPEKFLIDV